jgi:hypothetical protein
MKETGVNRPSNRESSNQLLRKPGFALGALVFLVVIVAAISNKWKDLLAVGLVVAAIAVYLLPSLIAKRKPNASSIFVINLLLGWTLIGWVVAMAMAVTKPATVHVLSQPLVAQVITGRSCPFCAEQIQPAAIVCKHCGRDLPVVSV